jgi:hypothetical protein
MAESNFIIKIESFHETIQNDIHDNYSKLIADISSVSLLFRLCLLINEQGYNLSNSLYCPTKLKEII